MTKKIILESLAKLYEVDTNKLELLSDLYKLESGEGKNKKVLQCITIKAPCYKKYYTKCMIEGEPIQIVYKNQINKDGIVVPMGQILQGYMLKSTSDFAGKEDIDTINTKLLQMVQNLYEQGKTLANAEVLELIKNVALWCLPKDTSEWLYNASNTMLKNSTLISRALLSAFDIKSIKELQESKESATHNLYRVGDTLRTRKFFQKLELLARATAKNDRVQKLKSQSELDKLKAKQEAKAKAEAEAKNGKTKGLKTKATAKAKQSKATK